MQNPFSQLIFKNLFSGRNIVLFVIVVWQNSITIALGWVIVLEPTTIGTSWGTFVHWCALPVLWSMDAMLQYLMNVNSNQLENSATLELCFIWPNANLGFFGLVAMLAFTALG